MAKGKSTRGKKATPPPAPVVDDFDFSADFKPKPTGVIRMPVERRVSTSLYNINVKPKAHHDGEIYGLYNHDTLCGMRMVRDPQKFTLKPTDVPVQSWEADWVWYRDRETADKAAKWLQGYLDKQGVIADKGTNDSEQLKIRTT